MQKICFLFTVDVGRKSQNSAAMTLTKGITTGQKLLVSQGTAELLLRPPLKKEDSAKEINFFWGGGWKKNSLVTTWLLSSGLGCLQACIQGCGSIMLTHALGSLEPPDSSSVGGVGCR